MSNHKSNDTEAKKQEEGLDSACQKALEGIEKHEALIQRFERRLIFACVLCNKDNRAAYGGGTCCVCQSSQDMFVSGVSKAEQSYRNEIELVDERTDPVKYMECLRKHAELGVADAQCGLADALVDLVYQKAAEKVDQLDIVYWYHKAAAQKFPEALMKLGNIYVEGWFDCPKNEKMGKELMDLGKENMKIHLKKEAKRIYASLLLADCEYLPYRCYRPQPETPDAKWLISAYEQTYEHLVLLKKIGAYVDSDR